MSEIIKSTESISVKHPIFTIFGQPGICKTTLGYSCANPLLLDADIGCHRAVNRGDTLPVETWADVADLREKIAPYQTGVVDTVGRLLDLLAVDIIENNPKMGRGGGSDLSLQGFGALKSRFRTWMSQFRAMDKDMLLIAHQREEKDGDNTVMRPDIVGASAGEVMKISDFVGYVYMNGKDRIIDFNPTSSWFGKNPAQWKAMKIPPADKAQTFMADLIKKGREALGAISEESSKVASLVDDWRGAVDAYTTAEECTKALPQVVAIQGIAGPQVKKLLMDRSKILKLTYNVDSKAFVEAKAS